MLLQDDPTTDATTTRPEPTGNGHVVEPSNDGADSDPTAKLDAMGKEREALRAEVEQLRKQLEGIQETHEQETSQLRADLEESNGAKEHAEEQYQNLLGRVEKIKESLSDRLKRDKAELEEARERIDELEAQNEQLQAAAQATGDELDKIKDELQDATRELTTLRSRNNLSAHNWHKEKEELTRTVQHLKDEVAQTSNAMGEWEVLAMEERSIKESLADKVSELEEQVATLRQGYEGAAAERQSQATLVDNLQNALREIQEARKRELREMVETTESQLQAQKRLVQDAESRRAEAEGVKEELSKELERTAPFEKEVKEKNLLIGKLRHEAIVLNDHLTKALYYEPPPPLPHPRPRRRQALPGLAGHGRLPQLDRRAARAGRPRAARRLGRQPPPAHVALSPHAELAVPQRRSLLGANVSQGQGVARGAVGRVPGAQRAGGLRRATRPAVSQGQHEQRRDGDGHGAVRLAAVKRGGQ
ncbi:golgi matrix protein [Purpureocillium lilacinum]|uniref:Golgi matrix protein n=1 Tax=Purpureocillium lilacinum TaxID=33203 RepID=A0A179HNN4_PURLI|nr:golgi matrix protein [Purpureocillium lilacinum]OAQ92046.1 golgi matrix protein [Purpureocillium lilacinum]